MRPISHIFSLPSGQTHRISDGFFISLKARGAEQLHRDENTSPGPRWVVCFGVRRSIRFGNGEAEPVIILEGKTCRNWEQAAPEVQLHLSVALL